MTDNHNDLRQFSEAASLRSAIVGHRHAPSRFGITAGPVTSAAIAAVGEYGPSVLAHLHLVRRKSSDVAERARVAGLKGAEIGVKKGRAIAQAGVAEAKSRAKQPLVRARTATVAKPSRRVRRIWLAELEKMGDMQVQYHLDHVSVLDESPNQLMHFVDAGVTMGAHRFPTRQFVEHWLYGDQSEPEDTQSMRVLVIVALVLAGMGVLTIGGVFSW